MRAAILYEVGKPLAVETVELEGPRPGEVEVRIAATGVCHSDLHYIKGDLTMPLPVDPEVITRGQAFREGQRGLGAEEDRLAYQAARGIADR